MLDFKDYNEIERNRDRMIVSLLFLIRRIGILSIFIAAEHLVLKGTDNFIKRMMFPVTMLIIMLTVKILMQYGFKIITKYCTFILSLLQMTIIIELTFFMSPNQFVICPV